MKDYNHPFIQNFIVPSVGRTAKQVGILIKSQLKKHQIPITKEQFIVLLRIEKEPKAQSLLALITERDKGSLTRLVQSLEKKELVKRKICHKDNRVNWVEITDKGLSVLESVKPIMLNIFEQLQKGVEKEERETVLKVLQKIQRNAIEEIEKEDSLRN